VIDVTALRLLQVLLTVWLAQREAPAVSYLIAESRTLRAQFGRVMSENLAETLRRSVRKHRRSLVT
jgi:hypothetical protein